MNDDNVHTTLDEIFQFDSMYLLCILINSYSESINMIENYEDVKYTRRFQISIKRVPKQLEINEGCSLNTFEVLILKMALNLKSIGLKLIRYDNYRFLFTVRSPS